MGTFRVYLLRIIAVVIICSVIKTFSKKSAYRNILQFVLAIIMFSVVLQPLPKLRISNMDWKVNNLFEESEAAVNDGVHTAENTFATIITEKVGAYIVEKAAEHGAKIAAIVRLDGTIPQTVDVSGNVSPYVQSILSSWIESELGIPREAQSWN